MAGKKSETNADKSKKKAKSPRPRNSPKNTNKDEQKNSSAIGGVRGKAWTFPKLTLEEAIRIPKALDEKFAGNPTPAPDIAKAVGFNQAGDWRFTDLLRSANLYGLVNGTGATATVSMEQLGQDIVTPSSPAQRADALVTAFHSVDDFRRVEEYYKGKRIPEDEFFLGSGLID